MSTYPRSQNLQVAPRLLSANGGTWLGDNCELKILFFFLATGKIIFLQIGI